MIDEERRQVGITTQQLRAVRCAARRDRLQVV
jgi:hypothetical protein